MWAPFVLTLGLCSVLLLVNGPATLCGMLVLVVYSVIVHANVVFLLLPLLGYPSLVQMGYVSCVGGMLIGSSAMLLADMLEAFPPSSRGRSTILWISRTLAIPNFLPAQAWYLLGAGELLMLPAAAMVLLLGCFRTAVPQSGAVVLIHGNGMNAGQWAFGRILLALHGVRPVVCPSYLPGFLKVCPQPGGINACTDEVRPFVQDCSLIIGHSMGGLIAANALSTTGCGGAPPPVIFTVSTPWHGSDLLRLAHSKCPAIVVKRLAKNSQLNEMLPDSAFLQDLRERAKFIQPHVFTGQLDLLVRPQSSILHLPPGPGAEGAGPEPDASLFVYPHLGHYNIMASLSFWTDVIKTMNRHFLIPAPGGDLAAPLSAAPRDGSF